MEGASLRPSSWPTKTARMFTESLDSLPPDRAITAMTNDGSFRLIAVRSTRTVRGVLASQKAKGRSAENLADLCTASLLLRLTMAPTHRAQAVLVGANGTGTMVGDSWPDGGTRGLIRERHGGIDLSEGAHMQVMRTLYNGTIHQGVVAVSQDQRVSGALMNYLLDSEQITSAVGLGAVMSGDEVLIAGGYVVQLLPEVKEPPLAVLYERLRSDFADFSRVLAQYDASPEKLASEILWDMPFTQTMEFDDIEYRCRCSAERVLGSLTTLSKEELQDIVSKGEPLSINCDYCQTDYEVGPESLRGLIDAS